MKLTIIAVCYNSVATTADTLSQWLSKHFILLNTLLSLVRVTVEMFTICSIRFKVENSCHYKN